MTTINRIPALSPYHAARLEQARRNRARLACEERFDAQGGVWCDDEPGPVPTDRQQPQTVTVARQPVKPVPVTTSLRRARPMHMDCAQDIKDTGDFHKRSRMYHG